MELQPNNYFLLLFSCQQFTQVELEGGKLTKNLLQRSEIYTFFDVVRSSNFILIFPVL